MKGEPRADPHREVGESATQEGRAEPGYDRVILLLLFALFLLLSPIIEWWAADDSPWYAPYLVWALLIALIFGLRRHLNRAAGVARDGD